MRCDAAMRIFCLKSQMPAPYLRQPDGTDVQIMHNGIRVIAGGYYGAWMQDLITRCLGHHEPQEEVLFAEILKHVAPDATMVELGGFWSFYSIWFQSLGHCRRSIVVEADPAHLEIGRINAKLNDCEPTFISAFVGRRTAPPSPFATEKSGVIELPCVSVPDIVTTYALEHLDLLHCDVQGAELDVLESCGELAATGRLGWVVVSTHTHHISHDPLTHQRCVAVLRQAGATILAEHDVHESFSGDGLIVAKFGPVPDGWRTPRLSYNRYSESLFRNPLYDLAAAALAPPPALPAPTAELLGNQSLELRGGLFVLTRRLCSGAGRRQHTSAIRSGDVPCNHRRKRLGLGILAVPRENGRSSLLIRCPGYRRKRRPVYPSGRTPVPKSHAIFLRRGRTR